MKVVVAPDKFRGSLTASQAAEAIAAGVRSALGDADVDSVPMADGGEGTVESLVAATHGRLLEAAVTGPMGNRVQAQFGLLGDGRTAVLEMAAASGHAHVPAGQRDPLRATTRGTGELLLAAIEQGARRVVLGIGGSATNDGGAGLAQALGYRLLDDAGREIGPGGGALSQLSRVETSNRDRRLKDVTIAVACDVDNPLCGPKGASAIFGPQKGATPEQVEILDRNLAHFAKVVERDLGVAIRDLPGAGAAGGLGGGLVAFAGGKLERGIDLVIEAVGLRQRLAGASLCITGEGSLDAQSAYGKTAVGVARVAREAGCPVLAIAGAIGPGAVAVLEQGIGAYFSLCNRPMSLEEAMQQASTLLRATARQATLAFLAGMGSGRSPQP